jgi:hypothetical protein
MSRQWRAPARLQSSVCTTAGKVNDRRGVGYFGDGSGRCRSRLELGRGHRVVRLKHGNNSLDFCVSDCSSVGFSCGSGSGIGNKGLGCRNGEICICAMFSDAIRGASCSRDINTFERTMDGYLYDSCGCNRYRPMRDTSMRGCDASCRAFYKFSWPDERVLLRGHSWRCSFCYPFLTNTRKKNGETETRRYLTLNCTTTQNPARN